MIGCPSSFLNSIWAAASARQVELELETNAEQPFDAPKLLQQQSDWH